MSEPDQNDILDIMVERILDRCGNPLAHGLRTLRESSKGGDAIQCMREINGQ